ncbi:SLBB domain-containing protein [Thiotrichales bacterium HSG14]|nr:SLBB domain-containing protein [Thiotrichales bacterium HSG14]
MKNLYSILFLAFFLTLLSGCVSSSQFFDADPFFNHSNIDKKVQKESQPNNGKQANKHDNKKQQQRDNERQQTKQKQREKPLQTVKQKQHANKEQRRKVSIPEAILSSYRLGAGDLVSIKVFGESDLSLVTHLSETGTVSYPFLGELRLSGLTINKVEKLIVSGLKGDYLINPKVTVTILEYRKIFVNGEIKNAGGYAFVPGLTVEKAISLAGGFTVAASRDEITIVRNATPQSALLKTAVRPGDIIIIKGYQQFFVKGEVKNPGGYAFLPDLTVEKAITLAGGVTQFAAGSLFGNNIFILHDGEKKAQSATPNTSVSPGDVITVKESFF